MDYADFCQPRNTLGLEEATSSLNLWLMLVIGLWQ